MTQTISVNNVPANDLFITPPASIVTGQPLYAILFADADNGNAFSLPAGFTHVTGSPITLASGSGADGGMVAVATKVAAAEAGNYEFQNGGNDLIGAVIAFQGLNAAAILNRISTGQQVALVALPATDLAASYSTPTDATCTLVYIQFSDNHTAGTITHTKPTGFDSITEISDAGFFNGAVSFKAGVAAGAAGNLSGSAAGTGNTSWAVFSIALKEASTGTTVNPTGLVATASIGSPHVNIDAIKVSPTGLLATASIGTPSIQTNASVTINPTGLVATASVGSPTVITNANVNFVPTGLVATTAIGVFTIEVDITVIPVGLTASAIIGSPTVSINNGTGNATVTPVGIVATASLGSPTIFAQKNPTLTPAGLSCTASVGTPTISSHGDVTLNPTGLVASALVGVPQILGPASSGTARFTFRRRHWR